MSVLDKVAQHAFKNNDNSMPPNIKLLFMIFFVLNKLGGSFSTCDLISFKVYFCKYFNTLVTLTKLCLTSSLNSVNV